MNRESLICTVHEEKGLTTIPGLQEILDHIRLEVTFLEMHSTNIGDYFKTRSRKNLESIAVDSYRSGHAVELVSVDRSARPDAFFRNQESLHRRIE